MKKLVRPNRIPSQLHFKVTKDYSPIIDKTAQTLQIDPDLAKHVLDHQFSFLRSFLAYPTHPAIFLPNFGRFHTLPYSARRLVQNVARKIKRHGTGPGRWNEFGIYLKELPTLLRHWWDFRFQADSYYHNFLRNSNKATFSLEKVIKNLKDNDIIDDKPN